MKKILFFLLLSSLTFGQNLKEDSPGKFKMDTVVESSLTKEYLYSNGIKWLSSNFKDSRNVIETKDADAGEIIFKGNLPDRVLVTLNDRKKTQTLADTRLFFTGKIIVKDKKFRVILSDLSYSYIMESLKSDLFPDEKMKGEIYNLKNLQNARSLLNSISSELNKKADSDF